MVFRVFVLSLLFWVVALPAAQAGWGPWTFMGGAYTEDPDLCSELRGGGRAHMVARGADGAIWWRQWERSRWGEPVSLGGSFMFSPGITCRTNRIDVFAVARTQVIMWNTYRHATGRWTGWRPVLNMTATSAPAAVSPNSSNIILYVRGNDGHIWTATSDQERFNAWRSLGGTFVGKPSAAVHQRTATYFAVEVAAQGTDGHIWHNFRILGRLQDDVYYPRWGRLGPAITSSPEVTYQIRTSRHDYFGRNADNTLGHKWAPVDRGGRFSAWETLGGILASGPGAVWVNDRQLLVAIRGNDNALYYRVFNR